MTPKKYLPIPDAKIPFDAEHEAKNVIIEHTCGYMHGCVADYASNADMMEDMYSECSFVLVNRLIEGKLTPLQFAAVRDKLCDMIWTIFEPYVNAEAAVKEKERLAQLTMEVMLSINK
jgi:hypothetical protein